MIPLEHFKEHSATMFNRSQQCSTVAKVTHISDAYFHAKTVPICHATTAHVAGDHLSFLDISTSIHKILMRLVGMCGVLFARRIIFLHITITCHGRCMLNECHMPVRMLLHVT